MKHQTLDQINAVADVHAEAPALIANRGQRLERWAQLLEESPGRRLTALAASIRRSASRSPSSSSPISCACCLPNS
ncbi:hypothetical protein FJ471_09380, partial [Mesorhizobium sp. B2-7-1]